MKRQVFTTSRDLDFLTTRELSAQIGYEPQYWPEVAVKELLDNALDAAEDAELASPEIRIDVKGQQIVVSDDGHGIPPDIVNRIADFATRTSSREAYVGLSRGAQGNAWMTLLAMPHVLGGGHVTIESHGCRHRLEIVPDPLTAKISVKHEVSPSDVKFGTCVTVDIPRWIDWILGDDILQVVRLQALVNPSASIWFNGELVMPCVDGWQASWHNAKPAPVHWYDPGRFHRLLTAYLADNPQFPVRDFLRAFDGMAGTTRQKKVTDALGLTRAPLGALLAEDGSICAKTETALYEALCASTRPVSARRLGCLGQLAMSRLSAEAGEVLGYAIRRIDDDMTPAVIEAVAVEGTDQGDEHALCMNFTAPAASGFGGLEWLLSDSGLFSTLAEESGVRLVAHITAPGISFQDRGKRNPLLPGRCMTELQKVAEKALKPWTARYRKVQRIQKTMDARTTRGKPAHRTEREIAFEVMEAAYNKASDHGLLPAAPRQIMYAARPIVEAETGKSLSDKYFTQTLLWDFIEANPKTTATWKIAVDPRGNLIEPHTGKRVPLGTLQVERFLNRCDRALPAGGEAARFAIRDFATTGPAFRYGAVLFVEKEGFQAIFDAAWLQERYDIAIMSTKGMSVTAARQLIEQIDVPVYAIRDFDKAGFAIAGTLRQDTRRHTWRAAGAIDLGLRLADIETLKLDPEPVFYYTGSGGRKRKLTAASDLDAHIRPSLERYGATDEEIDFLCSHRVELNAMDSRQLVNWIEGKLNGLGVAKVVPDDATIDRAAASYARIFEANRVLATIEISPGEVPSATLLRKKIENRLTADPSLTWDTALRGILEA